MSAENFTGGCHCGLVRYRVQGPGTDQCLCHCQSCRRAAGAPYVAWVTFAAATFEVTHGTLCDYQSSPAVMRGHCDRCGTTLTYRHTGRSGEIDVSLTTLDDDCAMEPLAHIWMEDKLPWIVPGDGLPQYLQYRGAGADSDVVED